MRRATTGRLTAVAAVLSLALAGCGGAKSDAGTDKAAAGGSKGTVKIAINPWVGYEANAAVVAYLLEKELGYTVDKKNLKEEISWQGFETGEVDVVLENWGHDDLKKTYIQEKKVAVEVGPTGNKGVIGWYVPQWMAEQYPDITDGKNLNKYANLFKTSESGGKGQLLDGDPSFVTNDAALVQNLRLNYKVVYSGSEAALIKAAQQATAQKKPLLFYFYEPQWLFAKEKYARVKLPAYTAGCDADPKKVACDYPDYTLDKIASKKFADTGGAAYQLVKNFQWTNEDQNLVSDYITNQGMTAEKAAEKWVKEHEATWKPWIPAGS
ncbi:glycine/betaine-binding protein [Actinoplanes sp. NBRC 14428]|uniref:Glycine betaine/proline transport system substrate-binding protein n=1 Tax=Pseudosporangium ferrugineum TaxID=439699 RepID=A0A2T0SEY5_9ACTN|nr:ABC transporter substrate-binding protein [Pseudosporangium ferrugineum]PRY31970.1 glycine betaine/proline transport system substrate-binding protein [Pseudosporangium ferrugineum]BCJ49790.1 glycine/betaine-binding protein [Actinoplanes sp. NBRC 14428]